MSDRSELKEALDELRKLAAELPVDDDDDEDEEDSSDPTAIAGIGGNLSWVKGLEKCPQCGVDVTAWNFYCDKCKYGKAESMDGVEPPEIAGYRYIQPVPVFGGIYVADKAAKKTAKPKVLKKQPELFESVVLPEEKKQAIREALTFHEQRDMVMDTWGFKEVLEKGFGCALLFYGAPGTGKTLTGQAIAEYLGQPLEIVRSSDINTPMFGETEQKIAKIFKDNQDKVLLFDECDSLIYSREHTGAVLTAHVNVLLHELENHPGVVIFTTNHAKVLDKAFERRLVLKLKFELPSKEERKAIWQRMFPKKAPLDKGIDWDLLADFEISGGHIKNAVLRAIRITLAKKAKKITEAAIKQALKEELVSLREYEEEQGEGPAHSHDGVSVGAVG